MLSSALWADMCLKKSGYSQKILLFPPTSQLCLSWRGEEMKFPLASEKSYVFMHVWICLTTWKKGEVGDEQVLSKDLGTKGFYTAWKGVHIHCRWTLETKSSLYTSQRLRNVIFANALLVGKFQELSILVWIMWSFTCSWFKSSAVSIALWWERSFPVSRLFGKRKNRGHIPYHIKIQKVKTLAVGQN